MSPMPAIDPSGRRAVIPEMKTSFPFASTTVAWENTPAGFLMAVVDTSRLGMSGFLVVRWGNGVQWGDVRASRKQFERLLEDVIARVHEAGELALADDRITVAALLGMVNHTAQWYRPRGPLSPAEIADGYVDLLVRADSAPR